VGRGGVDRRFGIHRGPHREILKRKALYGSGSRCDFARRTPTGYGGTSDRAPRGTLSAEKPATTVSRPRIGESPPQLLRDLAKTELREKAWDAAAGVIGAAAVLAVAAFAAISTCVIAAIAWWFRFGPPLSSSVSTLLSR
jgi:hypothetical protein